MREFKVKDRVECAVYGKGVVEKVSEDKGDTYPIFVKFDTKLEQFYTSEGKLFSVRETFPTLKHIDDEPEIVEAKFKVGDKVTCCIMGDGTVERILTLNVSYPIIVLLDTGEKCFYSMNGACEGSRTNITTLSLEKYDVPVVTRANGKNPLEKGRILDSIDGIQHSLRYLESIVRGENEE